MGYSSSLSTSGETQSSDYFHTKAMTGEVEQWMPSKIQDESKMSPFEALQTKRILHVPRQVCSFTAMSTLSNSHAV